MPPKKGRVSRRKRVYRPKAGAKRKIAARAAQKNSANCKVQFGSNTNSSDNGETNKVKSEADLCCSSTDNVPHPSDNCNARVTNIHVERRDIIATPAGWNSIQAQNAFIEAVKMHLKIYPKFKLKQGCYKPRKT